MILRSTPFCINIIFVTELTHNISYYNKFFTKYILWCEPIMLINVNLASKTL
jgi:hypothetical protein